MTHVTEIDLQVMWNRLIAVVGGAGAGAAAHRLLAHCP